jgi:hypothetical protein
MNAKDFVQNLPQRDAGQYSGMLRSAQHNALSKLGLRDTLSQNALSELC